MHVNFPSPVPKPILLPGLEKKSVTELFFSLRVGKEFFKKIL